MSSVLTYVDEVLARQIATGLIGSEVRLTTREGSAVGINFKVLVRKDRGTEQSSATRVADLLPEVVADAIKESVNVRVESLHESREKFVAGTGAALQPGTPVAITNVRLDSEGKVDAMLSGEACVQYRLRANEIFLHAFVAKSSESVLDSLVGQPIEVIGILRYTPAYSIPGAIALSLGLRLCAVWLR